MGACRRILAALLFLLWSSVGAVASGSASERGNEATQATDVRSSSHRRETDARKAHNSVREPTKGGDDDDSSGVVLFGHDLLAFRSSTADVGCCVERRPSRRGPLAGRPRGPPTRV